MLATLLLSLSDVTGGFHMLTTFSGPDRAWMMIEEHEKLQFST